MSKENESKLPASPAQNLVSPEPANGEKCQKCGKQNTLDATHCMQCGDLLSGIQCQCGKQNTQDAKYCTKCGKLLNKTKYGRYQPLAKNIKISLQMFVGVILVVLTIVKFFYSIVIGIFNISPTNHIRLLDPPLLAIVGYALAFSTAFELAYTLYTPGPDEAVDPLITGLAAAILVILSEDSSIALVSAGGVALLILALIALFIFKYILFDEKGKEWISFLRGKDTQRQIPSNPISSGNESADSSSMASTSLKP
jgi:ribosomal protein L40E